MLLVGRAGHRQVADRPGRLRAGGGRAAPAAALPVLAPLHRAPPSTRSSSSSSAPRASRATTRPRAKLDKLEALLAQGTERVGEVAPLIAAMLSIPTDGRYPPLAHEPAAAEGADDRGAGRAAPRARAAEAGAVRLRGPALGRSQHARRPRPGHRSDRSAARVLLLLTFRPEFASPWKSRSHVTVHSLNRLGRRQSAALVGAGDRRQGAAPRGPRPDRRQDGRGAAVRGGADQDRAGGRLPAGAGDRYVLAGPLPPLAIPSTLRDSLMARLDRWRR